MKVKKKFELDEKPLYNVVQVYRSRGNYLQRLELFEKAIKAYDEALRWNDSDVRSLIGRSVARAKATHYVGALADAARAAELEPENPYALQIRALTEYEKGAFERSLVLAQRGQRIRKTPPDFANCARIAEETIRDCVGKPSSRKVLSTHRHVRKMELQSQNSEENVPEKPQRVSRMQIQPTERVQEMTRIEKQRANLISRMMASKYLERMAHDKYFLTSLCKDERLISANHKGSLELQELANQALADITKRQEVLRERRPLYEARASEEAAAARLSKAHKQLVARTIEQHKADANRLIQATLAHLEKRDTAKCLEQAEFAMDQISRKPASMLPGKEKFLQELQNIVAQNFLNQKRTSDLCESDLEKRAFILLGIALSREPSRDSVLRVRPPEPPRDSKHRIRRLERALSLAARTTERCYVLHELSRLLIDTKQGMKARFYAAKCQSEARAAGLQNWLLNSTFLLARCHVQQNNRPEARAALTEGAALARSFRMYDVAEFYETCANVSTEGDTAATEAALEAREREMISLMQDDDLKVQATYLFKSMAVIPASRRFSVMPGAKVEDTAPPSASQRRKSIVPNAQQPTTIGRKSQHPLGFQDFDI